MNRAREKLVKLAKRLGVELRQSYMRVGKFALVKYQRYAHTKQFKRANRALRTLKTYLGRIIRDISRKIEGDAGLDAKFAWLLSLARRVREQQRGQRGPKLYSLHAPEVECIGKGKPHKPYEFGVKVSVATPLKHSKGGQFVAHVQALPGNPYDGHTLAEVIPAIEQLIGHTIERLHADAGYRGHNAPSDYTFKVYTSKQKRRVTPQIKREMRRRSAVEPVIGHLKEDHRMGRNYLAHRHGDFNNAVLAAVGYNFRRLIRWLSTLYQPSEELTDDGPVASRDRGDAPGFGEKFSPGVLAGVEDVGVGREHTVGEIGLSQILPDVLGCVELRTGGWQRHEGDIGRWL